MQLRGLLSTRSNKTFAKRLDRDMTLPVGKMHSQATIIHLFVAEFYDYYLVKLL